MITYALRKREFYIRLVIITVAVIAALLKS